MALLSTEDRRRIWRGLMRYWSNLREALSGISKAELLEAVAATDDWIEANQVSYNAALPNPFKSNATALQKTLLFCAVAVTRVGPGLAQLLRRTLGVEVD